MPAYQSRPFTFDRVVRILAGVALVVGAIWLINVLRNVLLPFCLACLIAYLLEPLVGINQRVLHLKGRVIASLLTLLEVAIVFGLLAYLFVPSIIGEIHQLDDMIHSGSGRDVNVPLLPPELVAPIKDWINHFSIDNLIESEHFESILDSGTSFVAGVINFLLHTLEWLLTFIYVIFILIDYQSVMV